MNKLYKDILNMNVIVAYEMLKSNKLIISIEKIKDLFKDKEEELVQLFLSVSTKTINNN